MDKNRDDPNCQIRFTLPVCRLFSDRALVGIVAHELAHAARLARLGRGWDKKLLHYDDREERYTDRKANAWGFGSQIRAMRQERRHKVQPWIEEHEARIVQEIFQRWPS